MTAHVVELAYKGQWHELLQRLGDQPHLVNSISSKGYTLCTRQRGTARSLA